MVNWAQTSSKIWLEWVLVGEKTCERGERRRRRERERATRSGEKARSRKKKRKGAAAETQKRSWNARNFLVQSLFCLVRGRELKALDRTWGLKSSAKALRRSSDAERTSGLLARSLRRSRGQRTISVFDFADSRLPRRAEPSPGHATSKKQNSPTLATHGDRVERRQRDGLLGGLLLPAPAVLRPFPLLLRRRRRRLVSLSSGGRRRRGAGRGRRGAGRVVILLLAAIVVVVVGRGRGDEEHGAPLRRLRGASGDDSSDLRRSSWPCCRRGGRPRGEGVLHCCCVE